MARKKRAEPIRLDEDAAHADWLHKNRKKETAMSARKNNKTRKTNSSKARSTKSAKTERATETVRETKSTKKTARTPQPSAETLKILLSIRPQYAEAIFRGEKRFEFRRTIFRQPVDVVIVYVTRPVCQVVGEFDIEEVLADSVAALWSRTKSHAGINRRRFFEYFKGRNTGYAIVIGNARRYRRPLDIATFGVRPPQSFVYV